MELNPGLLHSVAPNKLIIAKREFDEMIKMGVIKPSDRE